MEERIDSSHLAHIRRRTALTTTLQDFIFFPKQFLPPSFHNLYNPSKLELLEFEKEQLAAVWTLQNVRNSKEGKSHLRAERLFQQKTFSAGNGARKRNQTDEDSDTR
ncbi:hypothetical protein AVEN_206393-1 [Araneus ventricosus]|uniref:Uncharacterized protein n=1 Tax=Araneus ventricosus TaxID=182803 RepID=A0A4Y2EK33_ARAVE|nr:hypothetical protein AVEN_206393-1 [Araneus ventricosus]